MQSSLLLKALSNQNTSRPPVWFMRQAGRYLPEYKELRKNHSLLEMFLDPSLIEEVTLMPVKRFQVDASILFSDILMVAKGLGLSLDFENGPKTAPFIDQENWQNFSWDAKPLRPIFEGVQRIKNSSNVPLIGFCGGPFTVATYLVEPEARQAWIKEDPKSFQAFLDFLADISISYLKKQIASGVDAIQIFDSWASLIDDEHLEDFCLKPIQKIAKELTVPLIIFMRGSGKRVEKIAAIKPQAISIDWEADLREMRKKVALPLQGNLDPSLLLRPLDEVMVKVKEILHQMQGDPGFIFNLGHGVLPTTPVDTINAIVKEIQFGS